MFQKRKEEDKVFEAKQEDENLVNAMLHERTFFRSGRLQNPLGRDGMPSSSPNENQPRTLWEGSHRQRE